MPFFFLVKNRKFDYKSSLFFRARSGTEDNMKEFILFELSRRLTHLVDTAPSSNNDLRSQAVEAVKTSIDASVNNLIFWR